MPSGIATAEQLAMMARVLEVYCSTYGVKNTVDRDSVAAHILELFDLGFQEEDVLLAELMNRRR